MNITVRIEGERLEETALISEKEAPFGVVKEIVFENIYG